MIKICNQPRILSQKIYDDEILKYIDHVKNVPGLLAVYTLGSGNAPGLSDIDFLCVLEENFDSRNSQKLATRSNRKFNLDINIHDPLIFPIGLFKELPKFFYVTNLKEIWRKENTPSLFLPPAYLSKEIATIFLMDYTERRFGVCQWDLARGYTDKRHQLRALVFIPMLELISRAAGIEVSRELSQIALDLREMRNDWNQDKFCSDERFMDLYQRGDFVCKQIIQKILRAIYEMLGKPVFSTSKIVYQVGPKRIICSDQIETFGIKKHQITVSKYQRIYSTVYAPLIYAAHLECYLAQNEKCNIGWELPYAKTLIERMELIRAHNQFLDQKKLPFTSRTYTPIPLRTSYYWPVRVFDRGYWFFNSLFGNRLC